MRRLDDLVYHLAVESDANSIRVLLICDNQVAQEGSWFFDFYRAFNDVFTDHFFQLSLESLDVVQRDASGRLYYRHSVL